MRAASRAATASGGGGSDSNAAAATTTSGWRPPEDDGRLDDLDDEELGQFLMSEHEASLKEQIWVDANKVFGFFFSLKKKK